MSYEFYCVRFGKDINGNIWTETSTEFETANRAYKYGLDLFCVAGTFGFAVVQQNPERKYDFYVEEELGMNGKYIVDKNDDGQFVVLEVA